MFFVTEPRATLEWILEWITAGPLPRTGDTPTGTSTEDPSNQTSKMGLLFEKNSLNSYMEKEIIAEAALKTLKNHKGEICHPGSDVIDDVTKKAVDEIEKITQGSDTSYSGLFSRSYFSLLGVNALKVIRTALVKNNSRSDNLAKSGIQNGILGQPCSTGIPIEGNDKSGRALKHAIDKLCSRLRMNKELEHMLSQPLLRNALSNIEV